MKRIAAAFTIVMVMCQLIPPASGEQVLKSGDDGVIVVLAAPGCHETVSLSVPSDRHLLAATMQVSTMAGTGSPPQYPDNVSLMVNDTTIWLFQGKGYGRLGMQNLFTDGNLSARLSIQQAATPPVSFRLPQDSLVQKATMEVQSSPLKVWKRMLNLTGKSDDDRMGRSVAIAGDVNGDGFEDALVGAQQNDVGGSNAGQAYLFFGNTSLDNKADVTFTGTAGERLGVSCAGAGDVNGDGYDDVIVGAHMNSSAGTETGRACIFFGGPLMDSLADVVLSGAAAGDQFGIDVSGGGDLNNDGYDDVIVGAHLNDASGADAGRAYIFFGNKTMDTVADVIINGPYIDDRLGSSVSIAGDMNGDGFDDVIVGASYNDSAASDSGAAYVFFGGASMDAVADLNLSGNASVDRFGVAVSGAGDVNGDGYPDVIVGSLNDDTVAADAGAAYIFFGGKSMDSKADVSLYGTAASDHFGNTVAGTGDVNDDGFDDVVAGAPDNDDAGNTFGKAYVFFGGLNMDANDDGSFTGAANDDGYGNTGRGGDMNGDGVDDVIIGAPRFDGGGSNVGRAYIFSFNHPLVDPELAVMGQTVWKRYGVFNGTYLSADLSAALNGCLALAGVNFTDGHNNSFSDLKLTARAANEGNITISNLTIEYSYETGALDFASELNGYIATNDCPKDPDGNFTIPLEVRSRSPGRVRLSGLCFTADMPPSLVREIKTLEIDEDCVNASLLDLYAFFQDDHDPDTALQFSIVCATSSDYVKLSLVSNRYISSDAATGAANDNWTGTVDAVVACADSRGQTTLSNHFTILVRNQNDPPVITSIPKRYAEPGVPYFYNVTARDGDDDTLHFSLSAAPADMTVGPVNGSIQWLPAAMGSPNVVVTVEDAVSNAQQSFSITVPNRPPFIASTPSLSASVGVVYIYNVTAGDVNNDTLRYELSSGPSGMSVNALTGVLSWTPASGGRFDVIVRVSDGRDKVVQNFSIVVVQGNRAPQIRSTPVRNATVDVAYAYDFAATDADADVLSFSIETGPANMTIDASRGTVAWIPSSVGDFTVVLKVSDGNGEEARQDFIIKVAAAARPRIVLSQPSASQTLKGDVVFSGTVKKGTRDLASVQMRIDNGEWSEIARDYSWNTTLDTKTFKNGKHLFEFRAYDGKEYSDVVKTELNVGNPAPSSNKGFIPMLDAKMGLALVISLVALAARRKIGTMSGRP